MPVPQQLPYCRPSDDWGSPMEPPFQPPHLRRASSDLLPPKGPAPSWDSVLARAEARDFEPLGPILERELPDLESAASAAVPRRFRHELLARDLVHDTLVKFLEYPELLPAAGESRFVYYLQVAVRNRAVDEVRRMRALKPAAAVHCPHCTARPPVRHAASLPTWTGTASTVSNVVAPATLWTCGPAPLARHLRCRPGLMSTVGDPAANLAPSRTQGRGNRSFFVRYLYNGVKLSQSPYPLLANSTRRFFQITLNQDTPRVHKKVQVYRVAYRFAEEQPPAFKGPLGPHLAEAFHGIIRRTCGVSSTRGWLRMRSSSGVRLPPRPGRRNGLVRFAAPRTRNRDPSTARAPC